jgi:hypothetical protein
MDTRNERAPGERGARGAAVSVDYGANHTTSRRCRRCGWNGDDLEIRIIETWIRSSPVYWTIRPTCPRCQARIESR